MRYAPINHLWRVLMRIVDLPARCPPTPQRLQHTPHMAPFRQMAIALPYRNGKTVEYTQDFSVEEKERRSLFRATQHVVDQGPVDVGAAQADGIEQGFMIGDKISRVRQLFGIDLIVTDLTEHHESP